MNKIFFFIVPFVLVSLLFMGCSTPKNIPYFMDLPDSLDTDVQQADFSSPKIQTNDILSVSVLAIDPSASASVNQKASEISAIAASSAASIGNQQVSGFMVDKYGNIELPILGTIKVAGLSTFEAKELIKEKARAFFVSPTVQVNFVNFKITVIGEVGRPASYTVPNEKISILDAIGLAGDLTIYGKRENVLLIRETEQGKKMVRFNLNNSALFQSPYYYLKQNDIVYVEPNKSKAATTDAARTRTYAIIGTVLSGVIIIVTRLF